MQTLHSFTGNPDGPFRIRRDGGANPELLLESDLAILDLCHAAIRTNPHRAVAGFYVQCDEFFYSVIETQPREPSVFQQKKSRVLCAYPQPALWIFAQSR